MVETRRSARVLVTGGTGQVGLELQAVDWPDHITLHAPDRSELDLGEPSHVAQFVASGGYAAIINSGAYTAVDRAETDVAAAFEANAMGPAALADAARQAGIPLIQVSTDYVFDGSSVGAYDEDDAVAPLGVYGASKLAGELAVLRGNPRSVVLRTAWVVSQHRANFIKTMLRLAKDRAELRVVEDQHGCPTSARDIAEVIKTVSLRMMEDGAAPRGIFHFVNEGDATWAELARAVLARSRANGGVYAEVLGITSAEYPTAARRPVNSRLSTQRIRREYGVVPRSWRDAVSEIVDDLSVMEA